MSKKKFKKPTSVNQTALKTVKILATAASAAIITIIVFFIIKDGWQKFLAWFSGKWACLGAMIAVFVLTIALWGYEIVKTIRKVSDDGE